MPPQARWRPLAAQTIAAILSGSADDDDFNGLARLALGGAADLGAASRYLGSVPVPDAEQALRDLAAAGPTVIWAHGSQYYDATVKVAEANPDIAFIGEAYGRPAQQPANMWVLDLQSYLGFYVLGVLAQALTSTGNIGYMGGLALPVSYSEVHAMRQALADTGADAQLHAVWTGDFNNAAKAEDLTATVISDGADVIVGSLNGAAVGTFRAANAAATAGRDIWVTAKYTDKSGPGQSRVYAGTLEYDLTGPLIEVLREIDRGVRVGYYPITFATGERVVLSPSVSDTVRQIVDDAVHGINDGRIIVRFDTSAVDG